MKKRHLLCSIVAVCASVSFAQQMTDQSVHSRYILGVDEYVPAPGQFVNILPIYEEGDNASTMAAKCTETIAGNKRGVITLGAYGGYVTFHFDHSIANIKGQNDFYISGNGMSGSSEPGIVMVSKDVNGNGMPDDPWYELSGSADADSVDRMAYGYQISYTKDALKDTPWTDNMGNSGSVARVSFHTQEYFPQWLDSPLVFTGTLLPTNAHNTGTEDRPYWVLNSFRFGYVDNVLNTDSVTCSFNIDWAVDAGRQPVELDFVDFVRVYTGDNQQCGWLGETSTEVTGAEDLHLEASLEAIVASESQVATFENVILGADGYWNGSDKTGMPIDGGYGSMAYSNTIVSGSYRFHNTYNDNWSSWSGFAVSNKTSVVFNSYDADQYNSAVGNGYDGSDNYAVVFPYGEVVEVMNKPDGDVVRGFYVTNTANNVKAYTDGDGMTGKFETGDWCKLTVTGHHPDGTTSDVDVYLADYRSSELSSHYYINWWQWVDLSALGRVQSLGFAVTSSHNNDYGMTTPGYFCMDNLNGIADGTVGIAHDNKLPDESSVETARYALDGTTVSVPRRGINIIRMSDGSVRKVFIR